MSDDMTVADFKAQFHEAAPEAPTKVDTAEVVDERPRDEHGRFVAVDPEAPPEETVETVGEAQEVLLAGKYKTTEDLVAAHEALQKKLGEQGAELGDLRALRQTLEQIQAEMAANKTPEPVYQPDEVEQWLQDNPTRIPEVAASAFQTGQEALMDQAIEAWRDIDPVGARRFERAVAVETAKQAMEAKFAPQLASVQQAEQNAEFQQVFKQLEGKYEDFDTVLNSVNDETIAGFPASSLALLQTGTADAKREVLETLYRWVKAEQAGTLTEAAKAASVQAQQESQAARANATVASATTSPSREAGNAVDLYRAAFRESAEYKKAAGLI